MLTTLIIVGIIAILIWILLGKLGELFKNGLVTEWGRIILITLLIIYLLNLSGIAGRL